MAKTDRSSRISISSQQPNNDPSSIGEIFSLNLPEVFVCHCCFKIFSLSQDLGGHQNAHKEERNAEHIQVLKNHHNSFPRALMEFASREMAKMQQEQNQNTISAAQGLMFWVPEDDRVFGHHLVMTPVCPWSGHAGQMNHFSFTNNGVIPFGYSLGTTTHHVEINKANGAAGTPFLVPMNQQKLCQHWDDEIMTRAGVQFSMAMVRPVLGFLQLKRSKSRRHSSGDWT